MLQRIIFSIKTQKANVYTSVVRKQGIWKVKMDRHLILTNTLRCICAEEWGGTL